MIPVGSTAVREAIELHQPLLALHGHIHKSKGARKIGRTLCINPGSSYALRRLDGAIMKLKGDRVKRHESSSDEYTDGGGCRGTRGGRIGEGPVWDATERGCYGWTSRGAGPIGTTQWRASTNPWRRAPVRRCGGSGREAG